MSIIASLRSAPPAFSALNLHPHGHKKGPHLQSIGDSDSGNSAPVPTRLRQTLFGTLLNSLEQAIGVQTASAAAAATGSPAPAGTAAGAAGAAAPAGSAGTSAPGSTGATAGAAPGSNATAQSSIIMLQNYLNNLAHHAHTDGRFDVSA